MTLEQKKRKKLMKPIFAILVMSLSPAPVLAAGTHAGGHMALGEPARHEPTRTIQVVMTEDYDGESVYTFDQKELNVSSGETVRLHIINAGEEVHEFVMDSMEANAKHKEVMAKFPEMEHDDPNAVRLEPGQEAEIVWTFGKPGTFEFACLLPGHYDGGMRGALLVN